MSNTFRTANKHNDVRACIAWTPEIASLGRQHNNANVLCIPARFVSEETALKMVDAFFSSEFEGGRHARRVGKIACAMVAMFAMVLSGWADSLPETIIMPGSGGGAHPGGS